MSERKCETVMMIEDHKLLRVGLKSLFEESGQIKVIGETDSGKEAIEKAKNLRPDVILVDIGLPDISGIETIRRILNEIPEQKTIILTSHLNEKDVMDSLSAGAFAYVMKDINTDLLINIIKT